MTLDISNLNDKQAVENAIIEGYDDPGDRDHALSVLRSVSGVDIATGMPIEETPEEAAAAAAAAKPDGEAAAAAETKPEEGAETGKTETKPETKPEEGAETGKTETKPETKPEEGAETGKTETKPETKPEGGEQTTETQPEGIRTPDGKILDYSVLEAERAENARLRAENEGFQRVIEGRGSETHKPGDEGAEGTRDGGTSAPAADLKPPPEIDLSKIDESIDRLTQDYGEDIGTAMKGMRDTVEQLAGALKTSHESNVALRAEIDQSRTQVAAANEQQAATEVQTAIDANPVLAKWQADAILADRGDATKSRIRFDEAISFDQVLGRDPAWEGKPLAERFARAAEMVRTLHGDAAASGAPSTASASEDDRAKAAAAAAKAGETGARKPGTLTDLPPGETAKNDDQTLEEAHPMDLEGKSLEEIDAILEARMG